MDKLWSLSAGVLVEKMAAAEENKADGASRLSQEMANQGDEGQRTDPVTLLMRKALTKTNQ